MSFAAVNRMVFRAFFLSILMVTTVLLSGCYKTDQKPAVGPIVTVPGVNGQGYGGDPKALELMVAARDRIGVFDASLAEPSALEGLCRFDGCNAGDDPAVCEKVGALSEAQTEEIRAFVGETRVQRGTLTGATPVSIEIVYGDLLVSDPDRPGEKRKVDGRTRSTLSSPIEIQVNVAFSSPMNRVAVLFHEMGHQFIFRGRILGDREGTTTFTETWGGQQFLDAAGACVAYASYHKRGARLGLGSPNGRVRMIHSGTGEELFLFEAFDGAMVPARVAVGDLTGDQVPDLAAATGPGIVTKVKVFDGKDGKLVREFFPYGESDTGGAYIALGDIDGDKRKEVITSGENTQVRIFDAQSGALRLDFVAHDKGADRGAPVAAGDITGDGIAEIAVAHNFDSSDEILVFEVAQAATQGPLLLHRIRVNGGTPVFTVRVALGDIDHDGKLDIIAGTAINGESRVRIFTNAGLATGADPWREFSPFKKDTTVSVTVAAGDIDGDGTEDVVVGAGNNTAQVVVFSGKTGKAITGALASFVGFHNALAGINVAAGF